MAEKFGIKDLVREDRVLVKEGKVFEKRKRGVPEDRYLFVFNDLVLVMKVWMLIYHFVCVYGCVCVFGCV